MTCYICGKKAIGRYSPDIDIQGVGFCKKHKEEAYYRLMLEIAEAEVKPKKKTIERKRRSE